MWSGFPVLKNCRRYFWTRHVQDKMRQYNLSPQSIKRVIKNPDRVEKGIAPRTVAVMQDRSSKTQTKELWVMYQLMSKQESGRKKIISAWIYPGKTKPREKIIIPAEVQAILDKL